MDTSMVALTFLCFLKMSSWTTSLKKDRSRILVGQQERCWDFWFVSHRDLLGTMFWVGSRWLLGIVVIASFQQRMICGSKIPVQEIVNRCPKHNNPWRTKEIKAKKRAKAKVYIALRVSVNILANGNKAWIGLLSTMPVDPTSIFSWKREIVLFSIPCSGCNKSIHWIGDWFHALVSSLDCFF